MDVNHECVSWMYAMDVSHGCISWMYIMVVSQGCATCDVHYGCISLDASLWMQR